MQPVFDQTELVRKFNFRSVLTEQDDATACGIVTSIISDGNYFTNSPKFQTKENIFARPEPIWLKYRMSFMFAVFMYLGREVKVSNMMAWSFMTNLQSAEDREKLWHNHWHPSQPDAKMLSGVYYLHIPDDVKDRDYCGTEIAANGVNQPGRYFVRPATGHWIIYPSQTWHRPGIVQSDKFRYVLAADIEYL
jgi:hypothetical protein